MAEKNENSISLPKVFVGSSVEGLSIARAIRSNLEHDAEIKVWNEGVFGLSRHALESISSEFDVIDFGIFVFTPDDITVLRGDERPSVRDNVILEMGMCIGRLGRYRTFIVQPRDVDFHLPTDLLGINVATYDPERDELQAALGNACDQIRRELNSFEPSFPQEGTFGLNILAENVEQLQASREYSLAVEVPGNLNVEVELDHEEHLSSKTAPWGMRKGPAHRIDIGDREDGKQLFRNTGPGVAETPIKFRNHGSATISIRANGERIKSKKVNW